MSLVTLLSCRFLSLFIFLLCSLPFTSNFPTLITMSFITFYSFTSCYLSLCITCHCFNIVPPYHQSLFGNLTWSYFRGPSHLKIDITISWGRLSEVAYKAQKRSQFKIDQKSRNYLRIIYNDIILLDNWMTINHENT